MNTHTGEQHVKRKWIHKLQHTIRLPVHPTLPPHFPTWMFTALSTKVHPPRFTTTMEFTTLLGLVKAVQPSKGSAFTSLAKLQDVFLLHNMHQRRAHDGYMQLILYMYMRATLGPTRNTHTLPRTFRTGLSRKAPAQRAPRR